MKQHDELGSRPGKTRLPYEAILDLTLRQHKTWYYYNPFNSRLQGTDKVNEMKTKWSPCGFPRTSDQQFI